MSDIQPGTLSLSTSSAGEFSPAAAEEVIRRAIEINERRAERVTLDELKATLAGLGVRSETVERAAAQVRDELALARPADHTPPQALGNLIATVLFPAPGVGLLVWAYGSPGPDWLAVIFGALWTFIASLVLMDVAAEWWQKRRLRAGR